MQTKRNIMLFCIVLATVLLVEISCAVTIAFAQEIQSEIETAYQSEYADISQEPEKTGTEQNPEEIEITEDTEEKIAVSIKSSDYSKKTVELEWDCVDGAFEYTVSCNKNETWMEIGRFNETKAEISIAAYGEENRLKICSYRVDGQMNGESSEIMVLIPSKLENLRTTAYSKTKVMLCWENAKGANAYQIYQKQPSGEYSLVKIIEKQKTNLLVKYNESYKFKVVPIFKSNMGTITGSEEKISFKNREYVSIDHQKYTYDEMCEDIQSLCKTYSEYVSCETIGKSEKGRKIYDVVLGNPEAENTVLVVSAIHGREYITTAICMKQLEYYLMNYNKTVDGKKISEVFSKCNVHYVMMANPDGVIISQTSKPTWKSNANGVNLNCNFPYSFKSEGSTRNNTYSGKAAASEDETKAIIKLTKNLSETQSLVVVNYHAMGRIVFGDYKGKNTSLRSDIGKMYKIARNTTGYSSASGYVGTSHGDYRSYLSYSLGIPSVTLEIGSVACPVPQYQYPTEFKRNKLVILREASWFSKKKK